MFIFTQNFDTAIIDLDGTMLDTMGDFVVEVRVGKGSESFLKSVLNHTVALQIREQIAPENIANLEPALRIYQQHYRVINGLHAQVYPSVVDGPLYFHQG